MSSRFDSLTKICTLIVSWHRVFGGVCCFYGHLLWIKFSTSYSKQSKQMAHLYHCKSLFRSIAPVTLAHSIRGFTHFGRARFVTITFSC